MTFRALLKRTFGIKNETWIKSIAVLKMILSAVTYFVFTYEYYVFDHMDKDILRKTDINSMISDFVTFYSLAFFIFQFLVGFFLITNTDNRPAKIARILQYLTVVSFLYNYNPWIIYHLHSVHQIYICFKYFFLLTTFLVPGLLLSSVFSSWIFWKMSRIDSDYEPCEVIYGGEDSVTKKLLDDF